MLEIGKFISSSKNHYAEANMIAQNEIREQERRIKAHSNVFKNFEFSNSKLQGALDNDLFVKHVAFTGKHIKSTKVQKAINNPYISKRIKEREKSGLDPQIVEAILKLPENNAKLFFMTDDNNNYMLPTKVLNALVEDKPFTITPIIKPPFLAECACILKTVDYEASINPVVNTYIISHIIQSRAGYMFIEIRDKKTDARLCCNDAGLYEEYANGIYNLKETSGKNADLN